MISALFHCSNLVTYVSTNYINLHSVLWKVLQFKEFGCVEI